MATKNLIEIVYFGMLSPASIPIFEDDMIERIMEYGFTFLAGAFLIKLWDWFLAKKQREIANLQE